MEKLNLKTGTLVIIEDDKDVQFLMRKILERLGVDSKLLFFENGSDALIFLQQTDEKIFMIISDVNMPVMNGLQLRNHIDKDDQLRRKCIPFIFLSSAATAANVNMAYDMTVQGFFLKESDLHKMEESLRLLVLYWSACKHPNS